MAHAILFDTLKYTETLMEAGVPAKQAKAQATALLESHETADLATRSDLEKLEIRLDSRFVTLDGRLASMEKTIDVKFSAMTWVLGMVVAGIATLVVKTFF